MSPGGGVPGGRGQGRRGHVERSRRRGPTGRGKEAGRLALALYERRLPTTDLRLTASPVGRMIAEHFAIREGGAFRYRNAQGVLALPDDFADYMRGRHRQALRTNIGHARREGWTVTLLRGRQLVPRRRRQPPRGDHAGPDRAWLVVAPDGRCVADSILNVDRHVAMLHGMASFAPNARWLLHAAIIERLCGDCEVPGDQQRRCLLHRRRQPALPAPPRLRHLPPAQSPAPRARLRSPRLIPPASSGHPTSPTPAASRSRSPRSLPSSPPSSEPHRSPKL